MACKICETRRPRRFCPGVAGDICAVCCGTEREVSVQCPFDCEYLQDARKHERLPPPEDQSFPNPDVRLTERFLQEHQHLLLFMARTLVDTALETPGAVDFDVREALDSLIRTYRTLESGLYYETRPNNPLAANIHRNLQQATDEFRKGLAEQLGMESLRDSEILGVLVFLQRIEIQHNNGRKRGRAFLDFLRTQFAEAHAEAAASRPAEGSPIILP